MTIAPKRVNRSSMQRRGETTGQLSIGKKIVFTILAFFLIFLVAELGLRVVLAVNNKGLYFDKEQPFSSKAQ